MTNAHRFVLSRPAVEHALAVKGFRSFGELARKLSLHRNTIGNYLAGAPVLPSGLEQILVALDLTPAEALISARPRRRNPVKAINSLLDQLAKKWPDCAFVLFGSRARGTNKPFSDHDLGVYLDGTLEFSRFSRMLDLINTWNEDNLSTVQLTNLGQADTSFLYGIRSDLIFLCGSLKQWEALLKQAGVDTYD